MAEQSTRPNDLDIDAGRTLVSLVRDDRPPDDGGGDGAERRLSNRDGSSVIDGEPGTNGSPMTDGGRPVGDERSPAVAGQFYAGADDELREQIDQCFRHEYGPGPLDETGSDGATPTALVSPHAGYPFSGPIAAHGFATLAGDAAPEVAVILGPNHQGVGTAAAVASHECWRTPLGTLPVDGAFASMLVEQSDVATFDDHPHAGEHSIEVQLPFLQYCLDDPSIVPICLTRLGRDRAEKLGRDIAGAIAEGGREAVVVSSTDLTHYEDHRTAADADEPVVDAIRAFDTDAIARAVDGGHTMCGPWATVAGLTAASELGADTGELRQYATSGQTSGRKDRVVGYCSVTLS